MLFILFTCIYITFFCRVWGMFILQILKNISGEKAYSIPHFSIVCLIGLCGLTVFAAILSLFMPLGGWEAQLMMIVPGLFFIFKKQEQFLFAAIKKQLFGLHLVLLILLIVCCLLVFIMGSWMVKHPDTLFYHTQTIQWIETYKAVPGIVHLHSRYGYQGLWFVSCAIFGFRFTGIESVTSLNITILVWFFFFVITNINKSFFEKPAIKTGLLWLSLLVLSIWSYTQVRLTATSVSPDFIAALLVWVVFYLLLYKDMPHQSTTHQIIIIFLSLFAITIKLSALPILLVASFMFLRLYQSTKIKLLFFAVLVSIITIFPFVARNIISSGYLVFPSQFPDIVNVDWKYSKELTILEKDYITAYAKGIREGTKKEIQATERDQSAAQWIPSWWSQLSWPDKFILVLLILSFALSVIKVKEIFKSDQRTKIALVCLVTGVIFWFIQAPDPRFGFGFIIAFPAIIINNWLPSKISIPKKLSLSVTLVTSLFISAYFIYRTIYFFSPRQLILPMGIENVAFTSFTCNGIEVKIPGSGNPCGNTAVPCTYTNCEKFEPRGNKITDGFRGK